ncbi:ThuA domain-containing protein [Cellulomonas septica]|uniref:ThuA domain-containing protein n=1 Tax=Cellulomonas septica TaxID=285080 RepID=UPI0031B61E2A
MTQGRSTQEVAVAQVVVLVGRDRYGDPWHDHAATSDAVATLLRADGHDVEVRSVFPDALDDVGRPDVLVVNCGQGPLDAADADAWRGFHDRRAALVDEGVAVLGLHQAANTFGDDPRWAATLGGRWVDDVSWHPPLGEARFRVVDTTHPVTHGLDDVDAVDERYADLRVADDAHVLLVADVADDAGATRAHPVVWVAAGPGRVLYDALGHDVRSYAFPSRRALLRREVAWLLDA